MSRLLSQAAVALIISNLLQYKLLNYVLYFVFAYVYGNFYLMPKKIEQGFTLIEILITLAIFSVVATIALPNLRNFTATQELEDTGSKLVQILKQAQSSAATGIKCTSSPSLSWKVTFSQDRYQMISSCRPVILVPSATPISEVKDNSANLPNYSKKVIMDSNICGDASISVEFDNKSFKVTCPSSGLSPTKFCLILKDKVSAEKKALRVDGGGVIYIDNTNLSCT